LDGKWLGRQVRRATGAALLLVLAGCASVPTPRPAPSHALPPRADSPFAAAEEAVRATHGDGHSGFHLLRHNLEALRWRLVLIDSARHSLDLQYYVWFGDKVGQLLMARVLAAADRGVRVRLLFDDLSTLLHDMSHIELRDAMLAKLDRHPNIEIRVFNAWRTRDLLGRVVETTGDFQRLNRRMHNKQMVADNRAAIIGGRNIGDEYFGLNGDFNFHDLDVLGVGPAARQASAVFDRYWNSEWVRPLPRDVSAEAAAMASDASARALALLATDPRGRAILDGLQSWDAELASLAAVLHPGRSAVHADAPSRAAGSRNHMPEAFRALMLSAQREVLITNAYIIPDATFLDDLRTLTARGVTVRLLTNSLASHDVPAVNSHYERWRRPIVEAGAGLHELRPDAAIQREVVETPPVQGRFVGLHVKAMVIDRQRSFVGSMNLDPRSEVINAEMGVVIDSEPLARTLAVAMERDMTGANSWRVESDPQGGLRWVSDAGALTRQPARSLWQRVENLFFKLFPPNLY
jgi:putative cardiolipin synthase